MTTQLIILNGGSSSGKTGIARCLQAILPDPWLAVGVDGFVDTLPVALQASAAGIDFGPDGEVVVGPVFRQLEAAWMAGVVQMVRSGARVVLDDVFLGGGASQRRWEAVAGDLDVLWVGVRCAATVAAGREIARGDRTGGMAAGQADLVHAGVRYDVEVDTTHIEAIDCARVIARHVG